MTCEQVESIYDGARSLVFLVAAVSSVLLFFMKNRKGQKACLYAALWLMGIHLAGGFAEIFHLHGFHNPSHVFHRIEWLIFDWHFWGKYLFVAGVVGVGLGVSHYRVSSRAKRLGESSCAVDEWKVIKLVRSSSPMFRFQNYICCFTRVLICCCSDGICPTGGN